jgi:leader peptidase (prepilin peptidase)/N-methyltransferase
MPTPLTPSSILLLALLALVGLGAGALANLAADVLPYLRAGQDPSATRSQRRDSPRSPHAVLHYLTLPWYWRRGGLCPHCGEHRPQRAPLLELAMIVAFAVIAWRVGGDPLRLLLYACYAWLLLTVLVIDLEHRLVLNVIMGPAAIFALAAGLLPGGLTPVQVVLGGALAFAGFFIIAVIGRGAMGMGDVKLAGVIGLITGYPAVLPALLAGILLGGLGAATLMLLRRATRKTAIAYAPYLSLGALAVLVWAG